MSSTTVFIACPIGAEDSSQRKQSDELLQFIIEPVLASLDGDFTVVRADKISEPGSINAQIAHSLGSSDIVIFDVSGLNPNVMYELGVRHGLGLPFILMAAKGMKLPFDIVDLRTIFYELTLNGAKSAQSELLGHMRSTQDGKGPQIPRALFAAPASVEADDPQGMLVAVLDGVAKSTGIATKNQEILFAIFQTLKSQKAEKQQEMAMKIFSDVLGQSIRNPDGLEKMMALAERMKKSKESDSE